MSKIQVLLSTYLDDVLGNRKQCHSSKPSWPIIRIAYELTLFLCLRRHKNRNKGRFYIFLSVWNFSKRKFLLWTMTEHDTHTHTHRHLCTPYPFSPSSQHPESPQPTYLLYFSIYSVQDLPTSHLATSTLTVVNRQPFSYVVKPYVLYPLQNWKCGAQEPRPDGSHDEGQSHARPRPDG